MEEQKRNEAEFRQNPITLEWVLVNPQRAKRPEQFDQSNKKREGDYDPETDPFAEGSEEKFAPVSSLEIPKENGESWKVRVIPNKFPLLSQDPQNEASGIHEIVITNHPLEYTATMSLDMADSMLEAYQMRIKEITETDSSIQYIQIFQNQGDEAGASIIHPHSQLVGLKRVPEARKKEFENVQEYFEENGQSKLELIIQKEKSRIISESENFVTLAPYGSRFGFEAWLAPKKHQSNFEEMSAELRNECAEMLQKHIQKLDTLLGEPSYNYLLQNAPHNTELKTEGHHWYFSIFPRLNIWAGFEFGTGIPVNEVPSEKAAEFLR